MGDTRIVGTIKQRRFETPRDMRYLTFCCWNKLPLLADDGAKEIVVDHLTLSKDRLGFVLYAWVVMPDHVHALIHPDVTVASVRRILSAFKTRTARLLLGRIRDVGDPVLKVLIDRTGGHHFWMPGGGYDRNIHSREEFYEKADYIEQNPVRRGMVQRPEDYPWSSAGSPVLGRDPW